MEYEALVVECRGPVGWLSFNRPQSLNAMNASMASELASAWKELGSNPEVRVLVVTGRGRGFQTGIDVKEHASGARIAVDDAIGARPQRRRLTSRANDVWKPVICAVNGVCAGAGLLFVIDADIVVASDAATFLDPHVSVGQVSALEPIGLSGRMPFGAIMQLVFLGRHGQLDAEEAHRLGLVDRVVAADRMQDEVQALAELIASNSPSAVMASKRAIWHAHELTRRDAFREGHRIIDAFRAHPDNREGPAAFAARRSPVWAPPSPV